MKIYLYNRQEAIKNNCYKKITTYEKFKSICLLMLIAILIVSASFLVQIISILLKFNGLVDFGFIILVPICFIIAVFIIPIKYAKEDNKRTVWLYRAIIKDENNKFWLVEQNIPGVGSSYINEKDEFYKIFKNETIGTITELKNLKMIKESKRYYICTYQEVSGEIKTIEIAKAYKNLKEVL